MIDKIIMYNEDMRTVAELTDYEDMYEGDDFKKWADEHLREIKVETELEPTTNFIYVEEDDIETVEVGLDTVCSICGKKIPAWEQHNEHVLMHDGHVVSVLESYHEECSE